MTDQPVLFEGFDVIETTTDGVEVITRTDAARVIRANHYLRLFPTGWSRTYRYDGVYVVFSIPANANLATFLFGPGIEVRELARLWAPDGHAPNALSAAVSRCTRALRAETPSIEALVSFADPSAGHHGGVYQAMSWIYTGQSTETRGYLAADDRIVARRSFHSNATSRVPNLPMTRVAGKHRYVRPLTHRARRSLRLPAQPYPQPAPRSGRQSTSTVGLPGSSSVQNPCASSLSAQLGQNPSQPSPNSENGASHSRHRIDPVISIHVRSETHPRLMPGRPAANVADPEDWTCEGQADILDELEGGAA